MIWMKYNVKNIVPHEGRNPKIGKLKVRSVGYEPEDDSWLNWTALKDVASLNSYNKEHPVLQLGLK